MTGASADDDQPSLTIMSPARSTYPSATELATAFGSPLYLPARGPDDAGPLAYHLDALTPPLYQAETARADGTPLLVIGRDRAPRQQAGADGWSAVPELVDAGGLAEHLDGDRLHVVVARPIQLHFLGFRSLAEVLDAMASLTRVEPA